MAMSIMMESLFKVDTSEFSRVQSVNAELWPKTGVAPVEDIGCIRKLRQLTCCLDALSGNDFVGSVFARRHLMKLISDRLQRQLQQNITNFGEN